MFVSMSEELLKRDLKWGTVQFPIVPKCMIELQKRDQPLNKGLSPRVVVVWEVSL